jgi:hypothetical protein
MESTLLIITIASLALTAVLALMLTVILLDKRRRSQARVAVLAEMAADAQSATAHQSALDDYEILPVEPMISSGELFTPHQEPSAWPKRTAVAGAIALVILLGIVFRPSLPRFGSSNVNSQANAAPVSAPAENGGTTHLLELLSLKHDQETNALKITGLVQNPRHGAQLSRITATAMLFGGDGTFLASGRAPLDFTTLRPGEESGFVITVPVTTPVARYRVGFRAEDGRVIGHVDRRLTGTIARGAS